MSAVRLAALNHHEYDVGIEFPVGVTYEQWADVAARLQREHKGALWRLGDVFLIGEERFGELYAQAVENYSAETIQMAMRVCRAFPIQRRRSCGFSFHQSCVSLPPEDQDELLNQATAGDWTREEMRQAVRERRMPKLTNPPERKTEPAPPNLATTPEDERIVPPPAQPDPPADLVSPIRRFASVGEAAEFLRQTARSTLPESIANAVALVIEDRDKLLAIVEAVDQLPVMPPELIRALEQWHR